MDSYSKTGQVYLQPHKSGRKWKLVWLSLFPPSSCAVGRLEIQDVGGGAGGDHVTGVRRHHQPLGDRKLKVVRLSELISVLRLPPNAEACPMDNMAAFCVETQDRTMVFAALKDDCVDWVGKLCRSTFQRGGSSGPNQLHMEENQIYASTEQASEFWVLVDKTDAATRCGLQGSYWLQVGQEALLLRETQKKSTVREWPYELLRRYGRDKGTLTIEAGRRCDSGPGTFTFETQQAEKIFSLIQITIKQKTSAAALDNHNQEDEKINIANGCSCSPLPKRPDVTTEAAPLGSSLKTELCAQSQPAPITLMPLPLVPTHNNPSGVHQSDQSDMVYADPADCIQSTPQLSTAQYVDPASVLPLTPPGPTNPPQPSLNTEPLDSVYSEVYDRLSLGCATPATVQTTHSEPIYTEPLMQSKEATQTSDRNPDSFAHLYAQVCKPAPFTGPPTSPSPPPSCPAPSASVRGNITSDTGRHLSDVIYENLGII